MPTEAANLPALDHTEPVGEFFQGRNSEVEYRDIAEGIWRRKYVLLGFVLVGLLCGLLLALTSKQRYTASTRVELTDVSSRTGSSDSQYSSVGDLNSSELLSTEIRTQLAEITDESTIIAAVQMLGLENQPPYAIPAELKPGDPMAAERGLPLDQAPRHRAQVIAIFKSHMGADEVKGTRLLEITYTDANPKLAAESANAVVDAYLAQSSKRQTEFVNQVSSVLQAQLNQLKQRVTETQKQAEKYAEANQKDLAGVTIASSAAGGRAPGQHSDVAGAPSGESVPLSRLLFLNNELTKAQIATQAKEAIYRATKSEDVQTVLAMGNSALVEMAGNESSFTANSRGLAPLEELRGQQVQIELQVATARTKYGVKSPVLINLLNQQAAIRRQVQQELVNVRERAGKDLEIARRTEGALRQQVLSQEQSVTQWASKADTLLLYQGEAVSSRDLYQDIYARLQEAQFAAGQKASRINIVSRASMPVAPSSPNRPRDVLGGFLVGFVLGAIVIAVLELLDDSLYTERMFRRSFQLPVAGVAPRFPKHDGGTVPWVIKDPGSPFAEAYRRIRSSFFSPSGLQKNQVVLVTSASSGEGKATTCLNMGAAIAKQGSRVLILDADLRRKQTKQILSVSAKEGLSDLLEARASYEQLVYPYPQVPGLFLMPAGTPTENASELLTSPALSALLHQLRTDFDYVFIDSPPVLVSADANLLTPLVDGFLIVVRLASTSKAKVAAAIDQLRSGRSKLLGVLLNGSEQSPTSYAEQGY